MSSKTYAKPSLQRAAALAAVTAQKAPPMKTISGKLFKPT